MTKNNPHLWKTINRHDFLEKIVLDLGCSLGYAIEKRFLQHNPKYIIGVDKNRNALEKAKNLQNVNYICCRFEELPIESGSIDIVVSTYANFLKCNLRSRLKEVYRVLKPTGEITVVSTVHENFKECKDSIEKIFKEYFDNVRVTIRNGLATLIANK